MRFGNLCVHARTIACIFCYFVAVMNTGIVVVLLSLGVVCAVLGLLLLSCVGITPVCRTNGPLRTKLAAWPRSRAGCPKRKPLPPKSKSAPWSSGVRWRRPVWRRPNSEWPRHVPNAKNGGNFPDPVQEPRQ